MAGLISLPIEDRIVLYLSDFGSLEDVYETTVDQTQKGISKNVGVQRKHISRYLKKLLEKDIICETKCHVQGAKQRMKCYFLSWNGRHHAKDIRESVGAKKVRMSMDGKVVQIRMSEIDGATSVHLTLSDIVVEAMKASDHLVKEELETIEERKRKELDDRTRKSEIYCQALHTAWRDGVLTPSEKHLIGALKEHLKVSDEQHDIIETEIIKNMKYAKAELLELYTEVNEIIGQSPTAREKKVLDLLLGCLNSE